MVRIAQSRNRVLVMSLLAAAAVAPAAMAIGQESAGGNDPSNDATSLQPYGVGGNGHNGGTGNVPPGAAPFINNRPAPSPIAPPYLIPRIPTGPNGGAYGTPVGEGPMHPAVFPPPNVAPTVPMPSPFGLGLTGLLAASAVRRRRTR